MTKIFVTGHRNPDMDSTCSAVVYSHFKNIIDHKNQYIPIRCGSLNQQTKYIFDKLEITPPIMVKDLYPRVKDILNATPMRVDVDDPVIEAMKKITDRTVNILPVYEEGQQVGLISINEVSKLLLSEYSYQRPVYGFVSNNFAKVLPGEFLKIGEKTHFKASLMVASMSYEVSLKHIAKLNKQKPVFIVGERYDLLEYAIKEQFPAVVLTGIDEDKARSLDWSKFKGTAYLSKLDTAETTRLLRLSIPVREVMGSDYPSLCEEDLFDDAKKELMGSELRGLPVYSNGSFQGVVTRRCFIDRPKPNIILVDHNEPGQSIAGIENAVVKEIIDHHRLDAEKTSKPIYMAVAPVGSTCTIVYQHFLQHKIDLKENDACLLLAGILSDTVMLKSPTTTLFDSKAVESLAEIANVDWHEFGEELFQQTTVLTEVEPEKVITADFKVYEEFGIKVGIGQVEVVTLEDVGEVQEKMLATLERIRNQQQLDWTMLLITNVLKENSILLTTAYKHGEKRLIYKKLGAGCYDLPGILSRKKQLLPEIFRVLEEVAGR